MTISDIFGKLRLSDIPFHNPIIMGAGIFMLLVVLVVLGSITYFRRWKWIFKDWVFSVDHKKIGIMYLILGFVMLLRGFSDAVMMRTQQALAAGAPGYLPPEHYDQVFTAHGVIMIFFVAMPLVFGLINLIMPLQIGTRDVAFPRLNSISLWLTVLSSFLVNISLVVGKFAATGWLAYPPLSGIIYSPGVGVDYYIWALQISGVASLLSAINFIVTILKMRAPGMTMMKMPIFVWTALASSMLVCLVFPVLTATLAMLFLDRFMGMHFFTIAAGGNAMMYVNLIWAWGHPEVYILVLPAFGIFSEIVPTFSRKPLFGYTSMVWATMSITVLSFLVWLHHFFTMGAGADVNAFFGIMTMIIAVPTGVKVFNWIFTMWRGRVTFSTPMLWTIGFLFTFTLGGMTGVLMSIPAVDFQTHNSLFLVAHFHNTIIGGVVFALFAAVTYWFPKAFGFKLNEKLGKWAFGCWLGGFYLAFAPLYIVGIMGMTRRLNHYPLSTGWHPYLIIALVGTGVVALGVVFQVAQLIVSVKNRHKEGYADKTGDPWDGRTLEWATSSPPAFYNFAFTPKVEHRDEFWEMKKKGLKALSHDGRPYEDIHMPKSTSMGFIMGVSSFVFGFAIVWHIPWLFCVGSLGLLLPVIYSAFYDNIDYYVDAGVVETIESKRDAV